MKFLIILFILFILIISSGCAITDEERLVRQQHIADIEKEFYSFVADCYMTEGELVIDKSLEDRRVQNAPITVWEMKDAVCYYGDAYPRRMN